MPVAVRYNHRQPHQDLWDQIEKDNLADEKQGKEPLEGMGPDADLLLNLIKEDKPKFYREILTDREVRDQFRIRCNQMFRETLHLMQQEGLREDEAKEITWPPLCQDFGVW